ncbi:hypothetical protein CFAM422_002236 [Trichoderma lentiforme]|uniref:Uncharacterized protein n=1 Tax=Trichoderma lentiforme TaxID=1567552 RepID=A0A9P4XNN4_9HYPO|nr:hypothetical protein CFAM422_002236 [Trichoderma lentiforme]
MVNPHTKDVQSRAVSGLSPLVTAGLGTYCQAHNSAFWHGPFGSLWLWIGGIPRKGPATTEAKTYERRPGVRRMGRLRWPLGLSPTDDMRCKAYHIAGRFRGSEASCWLSV